MWVPLRELVAQIRPAPVSLPLRRRGFVTVAPARPTLFPTMDRYPPSELQGRLRAEFPLLVDRNSAGDELPRSRIFLAARCGPAPIALAKKLAAQIRLSFRQDMVDACVMHQPKADPARNDDMRERSQRSAGTLATSIRPAFLRPRRYAQIQQPGPRDGDRHARRAEHSRRCLAPWSVECKRRLPPS